ncbi:MAG: hypothetical protein R3F11_32565 [Verrucomicrobiales bacterium]
MPDDPTEANELFDAQSGCARYFCGCASGGRCARRLQSTPATGSPASSRTTGTTQNDDYRHRGRLYARLERLQFIRSRGGAGNSKAIHIIVDTSEFDARAVWREAADRAAAGGAAVYLGLVSQHRGQLSIGEHAVNQVPPLKGQANILSAVISHSPRCSSAG